MESENAKVVSIGGTGSERKEAATVPPDPGGAGKHNEPFRPLVVNREDLDPFQILRAGRGAGREHRRCIVALDDRLQVMQGAIGQSFEQVSDLVRQLADRDEALRLWLVRPWWKRLAFWRRPTLRGLVVPKTKVEPLTQQGEEKTAAKAE